MTENFVDYVKYLFLPVKEEKDLHLHREKFIEKAVQMEEMEVVADTYF
jgi:hypothetical protein